MKISSHKLNFSYIQEVIRILLFALSKAIVKGQNAEERTLVLYMQDFSSWLAHSYRRGMGEAAICFPILIIALFTSCEKEIEFNTQYENGIAVYAVAIPGDPLSLKISRSFTVNDNPKMTFSSLSISRDFDSLYRSQIVIKDAAAEILVNNKDRYTLHYNTESPYNYTCDYIPKEGDNIAISVKAPDYKDVYATAKVETSQKIDVVKTEILYKESEYDGSLTFNDPREEYGVDTVMLITLKIKDNPSVHNFYRLRIRGVAVSEEEMLPGHSLDFYTITDLFSSDDIIFMDSQLTKSYAGWKAGMTNVFDDHLFNGQEYTFTVESRKRFGKNPRVIVDLQSISQDLYYFLKSYMLFRISTDDVYTTPVGIYSNIENGWGIFGTLSTDQHVIYY
ncbi:MAG: DUF4249 domain-containing protein [Prevotella sp.]|nr:DUF4249 domain-containing protein [Prevotella sp.]